MNKIISTTLLSSTMLLTGCATILGNNTQTLPIVTSPNGAEFKITDERGNVIQQGITPTTVTLPKHNGRYFGRKTYVINFTKAGYQPLYFPLLTQINGKYIFGNILFGGPLGWFVLDPLNGGMYDISPIEVKANLTK